MWIDDLYGVTFPPSLEQFHRFWTRQTDDRFGEALGLSLTGPLDLLDRYSSIDEIEVTPTILVHWRFFSDPPELFTCLHGDADGLHFGLLLDDPGRVPRRGRLLQQRRRRDRRVQGTVPPPREPDRRQDRWR
jgi:hypothetical protein